MPAHVLEDSAIRGKVWDLIINNRAGGNAPMIAQKVAEEFLRREERT